MWCYLYLVIELIAYGMSQVVIVLKDWDRAHRHTSLNVLILCTPRIRFPVSAVIASLSLDQFS